MEVYRRALDRDIVLVSTRALLAELGRVFETKFGWAAPRAEEAIEQIVRVGEVVKSERRLEVIGDDPVDNAVLEAAVARDHFGSFKLYAVECTWELVAQRPIAERPNRTAWLQ